MQLAQGGVMLPPDLYIEFMNMPNKNDIINRVKQFAAEQAQMAQAGAKPKQ